MSASTAKPANAVSVPTSRLACTTNKPEIPSIKVKPLHVDRVSDSTMPELETTTWASRDTELTEHYNQKAQPLVKNVARSSESSRKPEKRSLPGQGSHRTKRRNLKRLQKAKRELDAIIQETNASWMQKYTPLGNPEDYSDIASTTKPASAVNDNMPGLTLTAINPEISSIKVKPLHVDRVSDSTMPELETTALASRDAELTEHYNQKAQSLVKNVTRSSESSRKPEKRSLPGQGSNRTKRRNLKRLQKEKRELYAIIQETNASWMQKYAPLGTLDVGEPKIV